MTSSARDSGSLVRGKLWWRTKSSPIKENPGAPQSIKAWVSIIWSGSREREHVTTK